MSAFEKLQSDLFGKFFGKEEALRVSSEQEKTRQEEKKKQEKMRGDQKKK